MLPLQIGESLNVTCTVSSLPQLSHFQVDVFALMDLNSTTLSAAGGIHPDAAANAFCPAAGLKIFDTNLENAAYYTLDVLFLLFGFGFVNSADYFLEHDGRHLKQSSE